MLDRSLSNLGQPKVRFAVDVIISIYAGFLVGSNQLLTHICTYLQYDIDSGISTLKDSRLLLGSGIRPL